MASWKRIAERSEKALSENYENTKDFFDNTIKSINEDIKKEEKFIEDMDSFTRISANQNVRVWKMFSQYLETMKNDLLEKLIKP